MGAFCNTSVTQGDFENYQEPSTISWVPLVALLPPVDRFLTQDGRFLFFYVAKVIILRPAYDVMNAVRIQGGNLG